MLNKHEAYVYNEIPEEYSEASLYENEFAGKTHEAIQSAIDYVHNNGGGVVYIASGKYTICGDIPVGSSTVGGINGLRLYDNIRLQGGSYKASIGADSRYSDTILVSGSTEHLASIITVFGSEAAPVSNVYLENLTLDATVGVGSDNSIITAGYCVFVNHAENFTMEECVCKNAFEHNVSVTNGKNINIDEVHNLYLQDSEGIRCGYVHDALRMQGCRNFSVDGGSNVYLTMTDCHEGLISSMKLVSGKTATISECSSVIIRNIFRLDDSAECLLGFGNCTSISLVNIGVNKAPAIQATSCDNFNVYGLTADGKHGASSDTAPELTCVTLINCNSWFISNSTIKSYKCAIFGNTNCSKITIHNVRVRDCKSAIDIKNSTNVTLVCCEFENNTDDISLQACTYSMITGCTYRRVTYAGAGNVCDANLNNQYN